MLGAVILCSSVKPNIDSQSPLTFRVELLGALVPYMCQQIQPPSHREKQLRGLALPLRQQW